MSILYVLGRRNKSRHSLSRPFTGKSNCLLLVLSKNLYTRESPLQYSLELRQLELVYVKRICSGFSSRLRVVVCVGSRDKEYTVGREHPRRLRHESVPVLEMLDHFKGGYQIERAVRKRKPVGR